MNTAGAVILALVLVLLAAGVGWIIFTRIRASQLGLPPPPWKSYIPFLDRTPAPYAGPSPAPSGILGWLGDKLRLTRHPRNARTATGAYEGPSPSGPGSYNAGYSGGGGGGAGGGAGGGGGSRGGFGHMEDDDPWDSRVGGYNPYEEERELGLVPPGGGGGGGRGGGGGEGYAMNLAVTPGGSTVLPTPGSEREEEEVTRGRPRSRSPGPSATAAAARADPFGDAAEPSNLSLRGVSPRPMDDGSSFAARKARREEDRKSMFREEV
ncbi:uncharacterized protein B0H64DRAFT_177366 [Chaetomium fimeti]|uniref:Acid phosphatase-like protein n=1 Tax=Chaetomium fimeti TaxID=1854472 RepID=A0AAE0HCY7_9PEZI|nr:hypothetical protein B0H64DRAFT_177366 [Chaetomium fimeti]